MELKIDREWCLAAAKREAEFSGECGAGAIARDPVEPPAYCKARNLRPYDPRDCMAPNCPCQPKSQ